MWQKCKKSLTPQLPPPAEENGGAAEPPQQTYERGGQEYRMPIEREPNPGSANERRAVA